MTSKPPINIGILGCADVALRSILPAIVEMPNSFKLLGIASRNATKAEVNARRFATEPFASYEALLSCSELEALYIPLPNSMHFEWVEKSLQKGIHVLVEKSMACSLEEVKKLNELASRNELVLVENFQFRFHRQLQEIRNLIASDTLGEIRSLKAYFGFPPFPSPDNIRYQAALGGGALLDAGAYTTKISQIILGEGLRVKASTIIQPPNHEVDIWGGAYLENADSGLFSNLAFGFDHQYQCGIEIWGSKGKLSTNRLFTAPPGYEPIIFLESGKSNYEIKIPADNHFNNMLQHFFDLIQSRQKLDLEYNQNIDQARLLHEIKYKSHAK